MWSTDEFNIERLMRAVNQSKLVLPQFQRLSVWTKANWVPFLSSVVRGRPTGTLLLLESGDDHEEFAPRPIETAPPIPEDAHLSWLLLDGQQRLTTLFRAFHSHFEKKTGGVKYEFVINIKAALDRGELLEEDFDLAKKSDVPGYPELALNGRVTLGIMYSPSEFENWKVAYVNAHLAPLGRESGDLVTALNEVAPGALALSSYKFPVLKIQRDTPLDVVVDIFEGMNRRGQKLDQFDLMVARLYRPLPDGGRYDLRAAWERYLEATDHLGALGVGPDDGMLPLKLIAKRLSRLPSGQRPAGVNGLNNKDVLELPPPQIIGSPGAPDPDLSLERAVQALEDAARFLRTVCGVRSKDLLAQKSMLLPLADQFIRGPGDRVSDAKLKRWFFAIGLRSDYYGSVNSYADSDCDDLDAWAKDPSAIPGDVLSLTQDFINGLDLRQACSRDGRILGVTVMCSLISEGARDWFPGGLQIQTRPDAVELHHVVPKRRLNAMLKKSATRDPIAGLTPLTAAANSAASDKQPSEVVGSMGADAGPILVSHRMDRGLLEAAHQSADAFGAFLEDREKALKRHLIECLGIPS